MGVLAALAGLIVAARLNSATPNAGDGMELDVIATCFIGGASASGGIGTVIGAVVGAFMIGVLKKPICWTRDRLAEGCEGYCVIDRGFI